MFSRRSDLPLDRDAHSRFLPWLIAFMVFLAVLAMAGTLVLNTVAARWDQGVSGTLTVQIAPADDPADDDRRLRDTLNILASTPGIERYEVLESERLLALLAPWLGGIGTSEDLPLPQLIDVEIGDGSNFDSVALSDRLSETVTGATIDDHRVWLERLVQLIQTVEAVAFLVLLCIGLATVGTVVFTTRTGLAIHREAIEVLHRIGAHDTYIAGQFGRRALYLGLKGGILGLALGVPTLIGISRLASRMDGFLIPSMQLTVFHWMLVAILPVVVAGIAVVTARTTVMRTLSRML